MFRRDLNSKVHRKAQNIFTNGVNAPSRLFYGVGVKPLYFRSAKGSKITSVNNRSYIDFLNDWGNNLLGHSSPVILKAMANQLAKGIATGLSSKIEVDFGELISEMLPGNKVFRFVNSVNEAGMLAVRLARAYTGKNIIVRLEGGNHGMYDSFLVNNISGEGETKKNTGIGILENTGDFTAVASYNKPGSLKSLVQKFANKIAAIIIEPVATSLGCIKISEQFIEEIRNTCEKTGCLLILDDTSTCFRIAPGGAQEYFDLHPDISLLGKVLGGGFSLNAVAGKPDIMEVLTNGKFIYDDPHVANPVILSAGYACLKYLKGNKNIYSTLEEKMIYLVSEMKDIFTKKNVPVTINLVPSIFSILFIDKEVNNADDVYKASITLYKSFYRHMLSCGILFSPMPYGANYVSLAINDRDIRKTLKALKKWKKILPKEQSDT